MQDIITELEEKIISMGLEVLEKWQGLFSYIIAVRKDKLVCVIYTTKEARFANQERQWRLIQSTKHLNFSDVEPFFLTTYTRTVTESEYCLIHYESRFSMEELLVFLSM